MLLNKSRPWDLNIISEDGYSSDGADHLCHPRDSSRFHCAFLDRAHGIPDALPGVCGTTVAAATEFERVVDASWRGDTWWRRVAGHRENSGQNPTGAKWWETATYVSGGSCRIPCWGLLQSRFVLMQDCGHYIALAMVNRKPPVWYYSALATKLRSLSRSCTQPSILCQNYNAKLIRKAQQA